MPLFLVTMASQNLPGFAVLRASGYTPPSRAILAVTGLASMLSALFGAHTSNLAAISAAICTGPDTHPDPAKRWMVGPFYALCYLLFAAFSANLIAIIAALPPELIRTVAGLALMGAFAGALASALADEAKRFPAVLTLAVTASGLYPVRNRLRLLGSRHRPDGDGTGFPGGENAPPGLKLDAGGP